MEYKGHTYLFECNVDIRCVTLFHNPSGLVLSEATSVFASQAEIETILDGLIEEGDLVQEKSDRRSPQ